MNFTFPNKLRIIYLTELCGSGDLLLPSHKSENAHNTREIEKRDTIRDMDDGLKNHIILLVK